MNRDELDRLVDEMATARNDEVVSKDDLRLIAERLRQDPDFARRTAEVFLSMRYLAQPVTLALSTPPNFADERPKRGRLRPWSALAASLLIGLFVGSQLKPESRVEPRPSVRPQIIQLSLGEAEGSGLELRPETRSIRSHHYPDGLLAGKNIAIRTSND